MHPLSNLIVIGQIRQNDCIHVAHQPAAPVLSFLREADAFEAWEFDRAAA